MTFDNFIGNASNVAALRRMIVAQRLPQTLLFAGPAGVGKATLARLIAAAINCDRAVGDICGACSNCLRTLQADLSREEFRQQIAEREKLPSAKRSENPLVVSTHPDFLIFPPDGPLRMITIEQARLLRDAAQYRPSEGRRRIFLIDHVDRANNEAANSLLKTLEEPADSLTLILTAENPYFLLPTIRSRSIPFYFAPLSGTEMERFLDAHPSIPAADRGRLVGWAQGSPGRALALDIDEYAERRRAMLALLSSSLGVSSFGNLVAHTDALARNRHERLDLLTESLYGLLQDLLHLRHGSARPLMHEDIRGDLEGLARVASFDWIERAVKELADLDALQRRNIQKQIALEALTVGLRQAARTGTS
ncbi:MAG: AAA family ATPase [Acidobacteria bacterium]|nr:AAA family ATPase [Acidobacteriota bacterium]